MIKIKNYDLWLQIIEKNFENNYQLKGDNYIRNYFANLGILELPNTWKCESSDQKVFKNKEEAIEDIKFQLVIGISSFLEKGMPLPPPFKPETTAEKNCYRETIIKLQDKQGKE